LARYMPVHFSALLKISCGTVTMSQSQLAAWKMFSTSRTLARRSSAFGRIGRKTMPERIELRVIRTQALILRLSLLLKNKHASIRAHGIRPIHIGAEHSEAISGVSRAKPISPSQLLYRSTRRRGTFRGFCIGSRLFLTRVTPEYKIVFCLDPSPDRTEE
jgi:hypothetical protein